MQTFFALYPVFGKVLDPCLSLPDVIGTGERFPQKIALGNRWEILYSDAVQITGPLVSWGGQTSPNHPPRATNRKVSGEV